MLHGIASLFAGMSLAEELHTICFTVFVIVGTLCCFVGRRIRVSFRHSMRQIGRLPLQAPSQQSSPYRRAPARRHALPCHSC